MPFQVLPNNNPDIYLSLRLDIPRNRKFTFINNTLLEIYKDNPRINTYLKLAEAIYYKKDISLLIEKYFDSKLILLI